MFNTKIKTIKTRLIENEILKYVFFMFFYGIIQLLNMAFAKWNHNYNLSY